MTSQTSPRRIGPWIGLCLALGLLAHGAPSTVPHSRAGDLRVASEHPLPNYRPRNTGAQRARIGGLHRGNKPGAPVLVALVPDHVAFTVKHDPSLCWYLSTPTTRPIMLTLVDGRGIRPVLEHALPTPLKAGLHCVRPQDYGVALKEQEPYRWFVTLVVDPNNPSHDVVAGGMIERVAFEEACALDMPCTHPPCDTHAVFRYAESGLWYDAIACLVELIAQGPDQDERRRMLDHLLQQSGVQLPG